MGQPAVPGTTVATPRRAGPRLRAVASTVALATFMLLAGCGDDDPGTGTAGSSPPPERVAWTLVLDYEPNAVHAGVLRAQQAGYFAQEGIDLEIVAPSSTADALTQVTRGKAQLGLGDLIDVTRRNERAPSVTITAGIVQKPLSGLIVRKDGPITTPQQLDGKKIAVSGVPSDEAVVKAITKGAGDAVKPELITLGFNGLKALDGGRVDATTAYWPADEVTLRSLGTEGRVFALDQFGGPSYPGLVAFTSRENAQRDPQHTRGFADALVRGTQDVIADPKLGLAAVQESYPELDAETTEAQLRNYVPLFGSKDTAGSFSGIGAGFPAWAFGAGLTERQLSVRDITGVPEQTAGG